MKRAKRIVSLLLSAALMFSLFVPISAATSAFTAEDVLVKIEGTEGSGNLEMAWKMQASVISGTQYVLLSFDTEKLVLLDYEGNPVTLSPSNMGALNNFAETGTYITDPGVLGDRGVSYTEMGCGENGRGYLYISLAPGPNSAGFATEQAAVTWKFAFAEGHSVDDLDSGSIKWVSASEAEYFHQASAVNVHLNNTTYDTAWVDKDIGYNISSPALLYHFSTDPVIVYPNYDVISLGDVEVEMDYTAVNSPKLVPTTEADRTVSVKSVKAFDTAGNEFDATEAAKVTYTYSLKKAGANADAPAVALTDAEQAYFEIDANTGAVKVKAGAPVIDLVVVANGSYINSKNRTSTADGEVGLAVKHGDAGSTEGGDPTGDEEPVFSGVKIEKDNVVLVTSVAGSTYTETIGIPTGSTNNKVTFVGTPIDQFGGAITTGVTSTWDDSFSATGVTVSNGTVTVAADATGADFNYKFSANKDSDTYEATVAVKVSNTVVVWPTLTNNTIVYGQPISDFTFDDSAATVTDHGTDVTESATFAWNVADDTATLNAGTDKLTMKVTFTDSASASQTMSRDYAITVNKADQVITIAQDGETPALSVDVEVNPNGQPLALETKVVNKTVPTVLTGMTINYAMADTSVATIDSGKAEITSVGAVDASTTLTITAAGNENYEAATRTLTVRVSEQKLRADVTFDTTAPVFDKEITATITESADQPDSITSEVTYKWGHWNAETNTFTAKADGINISGNLVDLAEGETSTTVKYTPDANDVGKILALQVMTPSSSATYHFIHSVTQEMAAAVAKGAQTVGTWTTSKTTTTIKVEGITGAEYAITDHVAAAAIAEGDEGSGEATLSWQDSPEFTGLTPNKEYDIHVRMKGTDTLEASDEDIKVVKTDAISIDPENPSTDPKVEFTTEPSVTISGDAKYGEQLTATLTDAVFTLGGEAQTGPFYTEYQWYRTTPAVVDNPETTEDETAAAVETKIDGATSSTYTLVQDDIGKTITVKVTPAPTSQFGGEVSDTTAAVEKADAPAAPTGITNTTKATNATSADGVLSGVADTMEYRLKAAEGAEEASWTSVASGSTTITGLNPGTYEIRLKETDTTKASQIAEVAVEVNGHNITGNITSYNAAWSINYKLINAENEEITGTLVFEPLEDTAGQKTQAFTISSVPNGTYTLVFSKTSHLDYTVNNVVVNDADLDLSTYVSSFEMGAGDINGDGNINAIDGNVVIRAANFGKAITAEGVTNPEANINGDSSINALDGNVIILAKYFGKGTANFTSTISYD